MLCGPMERGGGVTFPGATRHILQQLLLNRSPHRYQELQGGEMFTNFAPQRQVSLQLPKRRASAKDPNQGYNDQIFLRVLLRLAFVPFNSHY